MFQPKYDFEWNMLGIYNYNYEGKLSKYFKYLESILDKSGDIFEAGVFRGSTLLSVALFLKEKGSNKKVYGYDSFKGFPPIENDNDNLDRFVDLLESKRITNEHFNKVQSSIRIRELIRNDNIDLHSISTSENFGDTSVKVLQKKIEFLGLDNIVLIDGNFDETMIPSNSYTPKILIGGIIDCDLYKSYKTTLQFVWPKLINGGLLYLDEYYSLKFPGGKIAVDEFLFENKNSGELIMNCKDSLGFERWMLKKTTN